MPNRIRLQERSRAAASQSLDLPGRAHGAAPVPGGHDQAGVDELTGVRRALSRGGSFSIVRSHGASGVKAKIGGVSVRLSCLIRRSGSPALRNPESSGDLSTADRTEPSRTETIAACVLILAFLALGIWG